MITIELFKDHMHHVPLLADLWRDLLGRVWVPDISVAQVQAWMYSWEHEDRLPVGHIALDGSRPVGFCALQKTDGIKPELYPWLTDLCVDPSYQNHGVGRRLIDATQKKAKALGFAKLYLFAFDPNLPGYYQRAGFSVLGLDQHRGYPVTVMEKLIG
jgi:GNAT superfamily N-acetyltransferase